MEERLQKVLAAAGVASRREAEKIILAGRVKVNGKLVTELGTKVDPKALVSVDGKNIHREPKVYVLFYKPRGVVTTMKDPEGRPCIADHVKNLGARVFPVGRLDYNTEGLLLLTNDGRLAQMLTHPSHEFGKTYEVTVLGIVPQEKLDLLRLGVELEDGVTAPALVTLRGYDHERDLTSFTITIHEGRNRQVRRMCDFIGYPVRKLMRTKMGPLSLQGMKRGDCRELDEFELTKLLSAAHLTPEETLPVSQKAAAPKKTAALKKTAASRKRAMPDQEKVKVKTDSRQDHKKTGWDDHEKGFRSSHRRSGGRR